MWRLCFSVLLSSSILICWAASEKTTAVPDNNENEFDECSAKKKCKEAFTACRSGYCTCKDGYVTDANNKCVKAPTVGDKCALADGSILDCSGPGVDASCPTEGPNKDKCQCAAGYDRSGRICKFKDLNLNAKCEASIDCGVAFSTCQNNKCDCVSGFKAEKGRCVSASGDKCPTGEPLKEQQGGGGDRRKSCEVKYVKRSASGNGREATEERVDSCPPSHFCFVHPLIRSSSGALTGHCCPRYDAQSKAGDAPVCPKGDALKVDVCSSDAESEDGGDDKPAAKTAAAAGGACPPQSHMCLYAPNATAAACCPVPCSGDMSLFAAEDRCVEILAPGRPCKSDVQCGRAAACTGTAKVCTCKEGFTLNEGVCEKKA